MKLSLCNEVIRELPFDRQCALAAGLGYRGLEVAPFTFGDDAWRMPASQAWRYPERLQGRRHRGERPALAARGAGRPLDHDLGPHGLAEERRRSARVDRSLRRAGRRLSRARLAGATPRRDAVRRQARRGGLGAGGRGGAEGGRRLLPGAAGPARLQLHQYAGRGGRRSCSASAIPPSRRWSIRWRRA